MRQVKAAFKAPFSASMQGVKALVAEVHKVLDSPSAAFGALAEVLGVREETLRRSFGTPFLPDEDHVGLSWRLAGQRHRLLRGDIALKYVDGLMEFEPALARLDIRRDPQDTTKLRGWAEIFTGPCAGMALPYLGRWQTVMFIAKGLGLGKAVREERLNVSLLHELECWVTPIRTERAQFPIAGRAEATAAQKKRNKETYERAWLEQAQTNRR